LTGQCKEPRFPAPGCAGRRLHAPRQSGGTSLPSAKSLHPPRLRSSACNRCSKGRIQVKPGRSRGGFTLVEMLVVLVIVALMMALVGTSISRNISGAEMRTAASKVAASLRYTRTQAILTKSEQVFLVDAENLTYQAAEREAQKLPEGMKVELNTARSELTSETAGGIRFYPDGGSTGGNVRLEANGRIYRVNVAWLTGEASVERPDD
jgi:general secretion pathway protein H